MSKLTDIVLSDYVATITASDRKPERANIIEDDCIGCTKCIQACPVDAIIGTSKAMHTIISMECTGCGLCIPPCPVDCITLIPLESFQFDLSQSRARFEARLIREEQERLKKIAKHQSALTPKPTATHDAARQAKRDFIQEAIARRKAKMDALATPEAPR